MPVEPTNVPDNPMIDPSGDIASSIVISCSGIAVSNPYGTINKAIVIHAAAIGRPTPYGIVAKSIRIFCSASGNTRNSTFIGSISRQIPITILARGQYGYSRSGSIYKPISIVASFQGNSPIAGVINKPITIRATILGSRTAVNSIYGRVIVSSNIRSTVRVTATLNKSLPLTSIILGASSAPTGSINHAPVIIRSFVFAKATVAGFIGRPFNPARILISGSPDNRARSFLSPGNPVPQDFRHGRAAVTVTIGCTIVTANQPARGSISTRVPIRSNILSRTLKFSGRIISPVVITARAYDSIYGVSVPKTTVHAISSDIIYGVNLTKTNINVVLQQQTDALILGKAIAYAVISPVGAPSNYQAVLFF